MADLYVLDEMETASDWTVLGNDTVNLAASTIRTRGTYSLEFDKANGTAGTVFAGAYRTVDFDFVSGQWWLPEDRICWLAYISDLTNVAYSFVRLGTSASHLAEWRMVDTSHTAARWTLCSAKLGDMYVTGNGWNMNNIDYMAVGVAFDGAANELADIKFDMVYLRRSIFAS